MLTDKLCGVYITMLKKRISFKRRKFKKPQLKDVVKASRHPYAVPFFVFGGLIIITVAGYFLIEKPSSAQTLGPKVVIINHDHVQQIVPSIEPTVGKLLAKLHIKMHQGDVVEPSLSTAINQDDFRINIYRAVPVEIVDGVKHTFTFSAAATPRAIAEQAGIKLYPEDYVNTIPVHNFTRQGAIGEQVVIDRATPVNLNLFGTPVLVRTHAKTVGQLIKEKKIHLGKGDQAQPALNTPITKNMQVFLIRHGQKLQSVTQTLPMPVNTIYDNTLAFGTSAVRQQGSAGQEVITYQDQLQNGVVVSQTQIQAVVTVPPVTEIVVEGTNLSGIKGDMALAGIHPWDYSAVNYIVSHESGWCPTKWEGDIGYCPATYTQQYAPSTPGIGYGLCQSTPAIKMSYTSEGGGSDWATNPVTQLSWCNWYAHHGSSSFHNWQGALSYWETYGNW